MLKVIQLIPTDYLLIMQAESRLAARRQARAEAREIRMKELEKQQKEMEENADRQFASDCGIGLLNTMLNIEKVNNWRSFVFQILVWRYWATKA